MHQSLVEILRCPRCKAIDEVDTENLRCNRCGAEFFELNGVPCWFPSGTVQKALWDDLLAKFIAENDKSQEVSAASLEDLSLTPTTRLRLEKMQQVRLASQQNMITLLKDAGLTPKLRKEFEKFDTKGFVQYFELLLRDWGWHSLEDSSGSYREFQNENAMALETVLTVLNEAGVSGPQSILVIGSGAGRLSWDLHCHFSPAMTVALDFNPLLSQVAKRVVKDGDTLEFSEARLYPHEGLPEEYRWQLKVPEGQESLRDSWHVFSADAWTMPFKEQSFDLVITPWFLDINGQDCRDLIAVVERVLKPSGSWLNFGPFLYQNEAPQSEKYTPQEIREFLSLTKFEMLAERFALLPYLHSPLVQRGRTEECWCFLARSSNSREHLQFGGECNEKFDFASPPAWFVMPHLPMPKIKEGMFPQQFQNIVRYIDGTRSINQLAEILASSMPDGHDPYDFVYSLLGEYLVQ